MKKYLILLFAACCSGAALYAQVPEFPEPEFIGQCLAIRTDNSTEQLVQESLAPRHRASPDKNCSESARTISTK